jgi:hypothetical protein
MKTKILSLALIVLFFIPTVFAQQSETKKYQKLYKHSLGIGMGFTTGLGLSYRFFPKKIGFQINIAPYYQDYGSEAFVSAGGTILLNLAENRATAVYAYLGNHYFYKSNKTRDYYWDAQIQQSVYSDWRTTKTETLNTGIGLGFEFHTQKRVTLNIMAGYAQYNKFEQLFFTGELALYYRFNIK